MTGWLLLAVGALSQFGPEIDPGSLQTIDKDGKPGVLCPLKGTRVAAKVEGFGARVIVVQSFTNPTSAPIEAIYRFPLPQDSAVDGMRMIIGNRIIEGVIKKRQEARETYEKAKKEGKSTALLDQERPNVFTQSVANIPPNAEIQVAITYVQVLKYEKGSFEFVFPMVVGHRFKGESTPDHEKVATPIVPEGMRTGATIDLDIDIAGGAPITAIESDLHKILIENVAPDRAKVKLAKLDEIPNRDFILRYSVAGKDVVGALLTHREPAKGGFFTLIVMPPKAVAPALIAPKEMILVVDQSGSQMGEPIEKSRELTKKAIDALNPQDTFNVVSFSNTYEVLWPKSRPNSPRNREQAKAYVDKLAAQGGTQLEQAVRAALTLPTDADRPRIVVFNTDGFIGGEAEALKMIQKHRGNARMFTFGIGNSTNRYLIEAMSTEGRGAHEIVTLQSDIDAAIARLVQRVDAPVLTDVQVRFEGVAVEDVLPRNIPDLFSETPVIVKGRYSRPGEGTVTVSGRLAGKPWSRRYPVTFPAEGNSGSSIGSLWAREKVDDLEHLERMESVWGNSAQTRGPKYWEDAITELCLRFAIMSRFTSFVAVDQTVVNPGGQQKTIPVPLEMADGVSYEGIFGTSQARIGGKADERLAPTPATPAFRAGDPLLEIAAPADATVVAVFPDGDTKPLRWNPKTSRWEVRFDIPFAFKEAEYRVRVHVLYVDGTRKTVDVPFEVSNTAPELKPTSTRLDATSFRLEVPSDPRWARVFVLTPWGDRLSLAFDPVRKTIGLAFTVPNGFAGGWFRLIGLDRAHNPAEVRLYVREDGTIERIEPVK